MQILAHEVLNNAVLHGSARNPALNVTCELQVTPDAIQLQVTDEGPGFDWLSKINKGLPVSTQENGRGFTLYAMYADELHFNQTGNQVLLIRRLRKGIGLLVAIYNSLSRLEGKMVVINVSPELLGLFKAFRLDKHFPVTGTPGIG